MKCQSGIPGNVEWLDEIIRHAEPSMKYRELNPGNGNDFMVLEIQVMWPDIIITITSHKFIEFILSHG
ncbi:hypothetical protein BTHE_0710 [Bifidobacterium thermophilum]|nr:hypothetical protein BTHE_0710 [Bifidobacterium thermophilum]